MPFMAKKIIKIIFPTSVIKCLTIPDGHPSTVTLYIQLDKLQTWTAKQDKKLAIWNEHTTRWFSWTQPSTLTSGLYAWSKTPHVRHMKFNITKAVLMASCFSSLRAVAPTHTNSWVQASRIMTSSSSKSSWVKSRTSSTLNLPDALEQWNSLAACSENSSSAWKQLSR